MDLMRLCSVFCYDQQGIQMTLKIEKPDVVSRIADRDDPGILAEDLKRLCEKACQGGATDASVISSDQVVFSSSIRGRVNADDGYPSVHWPLIYPKDDIEEATHAYQYGLFFRVRTPPEMPGYGGGPIDNIDHRNCYVHLYDLVTMLESACFYSGYHLAMGLAAGNCRSVFCSHEKRCWPMLKGKACIHPNRGRPSLEAAGINAPAMAVQAGWDFNENSQEVLLAGLVMVT
jgi:predicted metal-binding protein